MHHFKIIYSLLCMRESGPPVGLGGLVSNKREGNSLLNGSVQAFVCMLRADSL